MTKQETRIKVAVNATVDMTRILMACIARTSGAMGATEIELCVKDCTSLLDLPDDIRRVVEANATTILIREYNK